MAGDAEMVLAGLLALEAHEAFGIGGHFLLHLVGRAQGGFHGNGRVGITSAVRGEAGGVAQPASEIVATTAVTANA